MTFDRLPQYPAAMNPQKKPYFTPPHFHAPVDSDLFCPRYRMADRPDLYMWDSMEGTPGSASSDVTHHMDSNNTDHGNETTWQSHLKNWPINRPPLAHTGPHGSHGPALFPSHPAHSQSSTPAPPRIHPDGLPSNPMGGGSGGMPGTPTPTSAGNATSPLVVPQPMKARTIKTYHCRMCDQEFHNKSEMTRHSKDIHGMEEKGHKCPKCFKSFPTSQQLTQHSLVHTNIRKFHCQYCDKTFKQLSHVQQHQRIHTGERPYKCTADSCGKAFAQLANLQQHLKNHDVRASSNDKKPYSCSTCDRRFATEASLNHHVTKVCCVHVVKPPVALTSPAHTLVPNSQPLTSPNSASLVANCGYLSGLAPVPFSYADLRMLGALAARNVMQSAANHRLNPGLPTNDIKIEPTEQPQQVCDDYSSDSPYLTSSDDDQENRRGVSPNRYRQNFNLPSHDEPIQSHSPPNQSHDSSVFKESQSSPEFHLGTGSSRMMELSKKDLNLLRMSADKLYSFPTQVPPLHSTLFTDKPMLP